MKEHFVIDESLAEKKILNDTGMQSHRIAGAVILLTGFMLLLLGLAIVLGKGNPTVTLISLLPIIIGFVILNKSRQ